MSREMPERMRRVGLEAALAAGLAVVVLPDPDRMVKSGDEILPQWWLPNGDACTAHVGGVDVGAADTEADLDALARSALAMLAAVHAVRRMRADRLGDRDVT